MTFTFQVPTRAGAKTFTVEPGSSVFFIGANGSGKTRLAVEIEQRLGETAHRISAHRALLLNAGVAKIREEEALRGLRTGNTQHHSGIGQRTAFRWQSRAATYLLNDYDLLVQALFADQAKISLETHRKVRSGELRQTLVTKFERLEEVWNRILPHRALHVSGDDIKASPVGSPEMYSSSEMSDGERAIFYLLGQTLVAAQSSVIIFDEPELHIHRSIMSRLWDELEALRPDCAMVLISHDLEFVASRQGQKFVLHHYSPQSEWQIEEVPDETGFSEEIATLILGSRKPVLFVEGQRSSLDMAVYRACYPNWTVIPRSSCEEVIHAVITMRANQSLTRICCAGVVDADDYSEEEAAFLTGSGIGVLPVSEIENLFLLPEIIEAIVSFEGYEADELECRKEVILDELFQRVSDVDRRRQVVIRYCRRRIDRILKKIDLSDANEVSTLSNTYTTKTKALDVEEIAQLAFRRIEAAAHQRDAATLLRWYDDKGLLAIACKAKNTTKPLFEQWIVRALRNGSAPGVATAISRVLPVVIAR